MKKYILFVALFFSAYTFAQSSVSTRDYQTLKGLSAGIGVPMEFRDLQAAGLGFYVGYDCAYPINDRCALGFYLNTSGGFFGEIHKYSNYDHFHSVFKLSAGLMMRFGDLQETPYLIGIAPCTGMGFYDLDLVLPFEIRFGRMLKNQWYIMGELTYGISLAEETLCLEPTLRVGYNFGRKAR